MSFAFFVFRCLWNSFLLKRMSGDPWLLYSVATQYLLFYMWIHERMNFVLKCWICPKWDFFKFWDFFFDVQLTRQRRKFWCPNTLSLVSFAGMTQDKCTNHWPLDQDVDWMSPVQGKSPLVQVKEPYSNLDMGTFRLSSCNLECTKYTYR